MYVVVGAHDAVDGATVAQRLFGSFMLLCGLALLLAATFGCIRCLWTSRSIEPTLVGKSFSISLSGLIVGCLPGLSLTALQLASPRDGQVPWSLLWLVCAVLPLLASCILWRLDVRPWMLKAVGSVLSTGIVVTLAQSTLTATYTPVRRGDSLNLSASLRQVGPKILHRDSTGGMVTLKATQVQVTAENVGDTKLLYLGGGYSVVEYAPDWRKDPKGEWPESGLDVDLDRQQWSARYEFSEKRTLVETGTNTPSMGDWISPGQKFTSSFTTYLRVSGEGGANLHVVVATARADRLDLSMPDRLDFATESIHGVTQSRAEVPIQETSWVNRLVREKRYATVAYQIAPNNVVPIQIQAFIDSKRSHRGPAPSLPNRWASTYGVTLHQVDIYG
jgi:hypothetical protein